MKQTKLKPAGLDIPSSNNDLNDFKSRGSIGRHPHLVDDQRSEERQHDRVFGSASRDGGAGALDYAHGEDDGGNQFLGYQEFEE